MINLPNNHVQKFSFVGAWLYLSYICFYLRQTSFEMRWCICTFLLLESTIFVVILNQVWTLPLPHLWEILRSQIDKLKLLEYFSSTINFCVVVSWEWCHQTWWKECFGVGVKFENLCMFFEKNYFKLLG